METINQTQTDQYFFCYSPRVSEYLRSKNIKPITTAIEPNSKRTFTLFKQSRILSEALQEYKQNK